MKRPASRQKLGQYVGVIALFHVDGPHGMSAGRRGFSPVRLAVHAPYKEVSTGKEACGNR